MRQRRLGSLSNEIVTITPHPLRVRPLGSLLLASEGTINLRTVPGTLGSLGALGDEAILAILGEIDGISLARCAGVSHALLVFSRADELWRALVLQMLQPDRLLCYSRCWRHTYALLFGCFQPSWDEGNDSSLVGTAAFYSDALFAPWFCGTAAIPKR